MVVAAAAGVVATLILAVVVVGSTTYLCTNRTSAQSYQRRARWLIVDPNNAPKAAQTEAKLSFSNSPNHDPVKLCHVMSSSNLATIILDTHLGLYPQQQLNDLQRMKC